MASRAQTSREPWRAAGARGPRAASTLACRVLPPRRRAPPGHMISPCASRCDRTMHAPAYKVRSDDCAQPLATFGASGGLVSNLARHRLCRIPAAKPGPRPPPPPPPASAHAMPVRRCESLVTDPLARVRDPARPHIMLSPSVSRTATAVSNQDSTPLTTLSISSSWWWSAAATPPRTSPPLVVRGVPWSVHRCTCTQQRARAGHHLGGDAKGGPARRLEQPRALGVDAQPQARAYRPNCVAYPPRPAPPPAINKSMCSVRCRGPAGDVIGRHIRACGRGAMGHTPGRCGRHTWVS